MEDFERPHRKITKDEYQMEREFVNALEKAGVNWLSLSKPYMEETRPGFDSYLTQAWFNGFKLARMQTPNGEVKAAPLRGVEP